MTPISPYLQPDSDDLRKLDRQIAERLGWRVEQWVFTPAPMRWKPSLGNYKKPADSTVFYRLVRPTGDVAYPYGKSADDPFNGALPHYTRDANAFFKLIGDMHFVSGRQRFGNELYYASLEYTDGWTQYGETRLIAGCKSWLARFDSLNVFDGEKWIPVFYNRPAEPGSDYATIYQNASGWSVCYDVAKDCYIVEHPTGDPLTAHETREKAIARADEYAAEWGE